jgi:hypothetical protein
MRRTGDYKWGSQACERDTTGALVELTPPCAHYVEIMVRDQRTDK